MNWLIKLFGFIVGASLFILALALIFWIGYEVIDWLQPRRLRLRFPIGIILVLIVGPIFSGVCGSIYAPIFFKKPDGAFWSVSPIIRALGVLPIFWCLVVLGYVFAFEPFGYSISAREWALIGKIVCFPAIVIVAGYFLFSKLIIGKSQQ
tara:strand:+ start:52 stop:501 length:450 start_codon:yes stop_codon:yes gene_type:complete